MFTTQSPRHPNAASEEERRRALELYQAGASVRAVAAEVGRSRTWVSDLVAAEGIARSRGGDTTGSVEQNDRERAVILYSSIGTVRGVAAAIGRSNHFVVRALEAAGITDRGGPGRRSKSYRVVSAA